MEKLKLMTGKEYVLAIGGFFADEEKVWIRIVTDETLERVMESFSDVSATQEMYVLNEDGTTREAMIGYTDRGNTFTRTEGIVVDRYNTEAGIQETVGNTLEFTMMKKSLEKTVEQNRADIDYLMMMGGEMA